MTEKNVGKNVKSEDWNENLVLTKNIQVSIHDHELRNHHVLVIGETDKNTPEELITANLLQGYGSYVVTDPAGDLLAKTGKFLESQNYRIRVLNLDDASHSNTYNPLQYIETEEDTTNIINSLLNNAVKMPESTDPFFKKAESSILKAVILYLVRYRGEKDKTLTSAYRMLQTAAMDKQGLLMLDNIFEKVKETNPTDICVQFYNVFRQSYEKTAQHILLSAMMRLSVFNSQEMQHLTEEDQMELGHIGDEKTIIFIVVPLNDNKYSCIVNMMYSQLFSILSERTAKNDCRMLNYPVQFLMNEFIDTGRIAELPHKLLSVRPYNLSCMIFVHSVSEGKHIYQGSWEMIRDLCSITLYLGGMNSFNTEEIKTIVENEVLLTQHKKTTRPKVIRDLHSRESLSINDICRMHVDHSLCVMKGQSIFYDMHYQIGSHPNAKYLGDLKYRNNLYTFAEGDTVDEGRR